MALIENCLKILTLPEIDWIEAAIPQEGAAIPQEGAAIPQEGAAIPQEGAAASQVAHAQQTDRQGLQGLQGLQEPPPLTPPPENPSSSFAFGEFPQTARAIYTRFPTADLVLVNRIVESAARAYCSVDHPKIPEPDDCVYAVAVETAAKESKKQTSAALFLKTVPAVIGNWAKCGRSGQSAKKAPNHLSTADLMQKQADRRRQIAEEK